ncbi:MAG: TIGR03960 family B12-binding radical SAM protein [Fibrobacterota bacterium]
MTDPGSLRERIFREVLPYVRKPARYAGGELHILRKPPETVRARIALCFPDLYEIGASNTGLALLYHTVNADPRFAAERAFMADADMRERLAKQGFPLYSLENYLPLASFDAVGFTLQYELSYPNIPAMLSLSAIPVLSRDRGDAHPVILAGGPLSVNPMPLSPIVDAFVIGDGEEALLRCLEALADNRGRAERLRALAAIPGVYVPAHPPKASFHRARIAALNEACYPAQPLVPLLEPVQDRYALEVMRGCPHGCRFCSAGFYYRPVRERDGGAVIARLHDAIIGQGWRDVSLLSLSTADYGPLPAVAQAGLALSQGGAVRLSLPSTRLDRVTAGLLAGLDQSRRTGITFAPEAGSERLRRVINKGMTDAEIIENIRFALDSGFDVIKLYFMTGLPTETEEDIDATIALIRNIRALFSGLPGRRQLNIAVSPFCPKPGTPFEREPLLSTAEIRRRGEKIKDAVRGRGVSVHWAAGETALFETVLSRGGAELAPVLIRAAETGLLLQSWSEYFSPEKWQALLAGAGLSAESYAAAIPADAMLPWGFLQGPDEAAFLKEEREKAYQGALTSDCDEACDHSCGTCDDRVRVRRSSLPEPLAAPLTAPPTAPVAGKPAPRFIHLFVYEKRGVARFVPHHDMMRLFERAFRAAQVPLEYSQGFSAHPRLSLFYPLSLGFSGASEIFQAALLMPVDAEGLARINRELPEGFAVRLASPFDGKTALERVCTGAVYTVRGLEGVPDLAGRLERFRKAAVWVAVRHGKEGEKKTDIRPLVRDFSLSDRGLMLSLSLGDKGSLKVQDFLRSVAEIDEAAVAGLDIERKHLILPDGILPGYPPMEEEAGV